MDFCPCHSTKALFGVAFAGERPGTDTSGGAGVTAWMGICGNHRHFSPPSCSVSSVASEGWESNHVDTQLRCLGEKPQKECSSPSAVARTEIPTSCRGCVGARDRTARELQIRTELHFQSCVGKSDGTCPHPLRLHMMPHLPQFQDQQIYPSLLFFFRRKKKKIQLGDHRFPG